MNLVLAGSTGPEPAQLSRARGTEPLGRMIERVDIPVEGVGGGGGDPGARLGGVKPQAQASPFFVVHI